VLDTQIAFALSKLSCLCLRGVGATSAARAGITPGMPVDDSSSVQRIGLAQLLHICGLQGAAQQKQSMGKLWSQDAQ